MVVLVEERVDAAEAGRVLAGKRRLVDKVCRVCGKTFMGLKRQKYCSDACNAKAYRQRRDSTATSPAAAQGETDA